MPRIDFALSPAQRADAREALKLLDGTGMSLAEAARRALHGRRAMQRISVNEAVDQFVRTRLLNGRRSQTVDWYGKKLDRLAVAFGERKLDDVDRPAIMEHLASLSVGEGTKAGYVRAWRALWRWAMTHEPPYASVDATLGLRSVGPTNQGEAGFLTVAESRKVLEAAGPFTAGAALLLFAGVRPDELAGDGKPWLLWRHVNFSERLIRIPADVAKTGKPRIIEGIPDTLWRWLKRPAAARDDASISPGSTRNLIRRAREAIKPRPWPHDATRHTFATYALAHTTDPGKVALWLGHEGNPTMLHRHYRGLATRAEGDAYFALTAGTLSQL